MKVINILGGSGLGKSTLAAEIFVALKKKGLYIEQKIEYAKNLVYENANTFIFENQINIFARDFTDLWNYKNNKVDYVVYDSGLITQILYNKSANIPKSLNTLILDSFMMFENFNIVLDRNDNYHSYNGRYTSLSESKTIDVEIVELMINNKIPYITLHPEDVFKLNKIYDYIGI